jgi:hypothetical protein
MPKKPRLGRPPLKAVNRRKHTLSVRVREKLRRQLEQSAEEEGRTLSQEVEFRVEQSFDRTELVFDSMKLAYGAELAGLLMLIGRAMSGAGRTSGLKGNTVQFTGTEWLADPFAYEQALNAAVAVLKGLRPPGRAVAAGGDAKFAETMKVFMRTSNSNSWGESYGKSVLDVLRGKESVVRATDWIERVKELLGPVGERVSKDGD